MVEIVNPVLDDIDWIACGSGGFLVSVLDYVRKKSMRTASSAEFSGTKDARGPETLDEIRNYMSDRLFGIDFDPYLDGPPR